MSDYMTMTAAILLMATAGCDLRPTPQAEAPPADVAVDAHYHLVSEGPGGRTILTFDRSGQVAAGGQLLSTGSISGGPLASHRSCRDDLIPCAYDGEDAVPVALTATAAEITRFYAARSLQVDAEANGNCADVQVRSADQPLKRYRYCRTQGLMEVETFAATGHPRKIALLDNCGIGSSDACEAQVPPVPLSLPES